MLRWCRFGLLWRCCFDCSGGVVLGFCSGVGGVIVGCCSGVFFVVAAVSFGGCGGFVFGCCGGAGLKIL